MTRTALLAWAPALAALSLAALLWFGERRRDERARWLLKPLTSALFLVAAWAAAPADRYDHFIVIGLALGAIGDVCLIRSTRGAFLAGLGAFLLAHVAYVFAFADRASPSAADPSVVVAILAMGAALLWYLWPFLGAMRVPVIAYAVAITLMLVAAAAVLDAGDGTAAFRRCVMLGALLFYLSDVTVARDRFVPGTGFANRAIGLPTYYAAQFLLAWSIAL